MSTREDVTNAIITAIGEAIPLAGIAKNVDRPIDVPTTGYIIVRDASPTIEDSTIGQPRMYFMRLEIPVEIYCGGANENIRAATLDILCETVAEVLAANVALVLLVNFLEITITEMETLFIEGASSVKAAQLLVSVDYDSAMAIG